MINNIDQVTLFSPLVFIACVMSRSQGQQYPPPLPEVNGLILSPWQLTIDNWNNNQVGLGSLTSGGQFYKDRMLPQVSPLESISFQPSYILF